MINIRERLNTFFYRKNFPFWLNDAFILAKLGEDTKELYLIRHKKHGLGETFFLLLRGAPRSPVGISPFKPPISLPLLCNLADVEPPLSPDIILSYTRRNADFMWLGLTVSYIVSLAIIIPIIYLSFVIGTIAVFSNNNLLIELLVMVVLYAGLILDAAISVRLANRLVSAYFAEILCIKHVLWILIALKKPDLLSLPVERQILLRRLNYLANNTLLLAYRYKSPNHLTQDWAVKHFKQIELYIRERERWIIAPIGSTAGDLKRDFSKLALIFISGQYGDFVYEDKEIQVEIKQSPRFERLGNAIVRIVGFIIPIVLMAVYLWQPSLFPFLQIDAKTVSLVFISWILLSLDIGLKLGIVEGLISLAKGVKELA